MKSRPSPKEESGLSRARWGRRRAYPTAPDRWWSTAPSEPPRPSACAEPARRGSRSSWSCLKPESPRPPEAARPWSRPSWVSLPKPLSATLRPCSAGWLIFSLPGRSRPWSVPCHAARWTRRRSGRAWLH